jgi:hypothetical protein
MAVPAAAAAAATVAVMVAAVVMETLVVPVASPGGNSCQPSSAANGQLMCFDADTYLDQHNGIIPPFPW